MFWHGIWKDRGKMPSGIIYSIMKKTRATYHHMLRALKKRKKHYKTKISLSKSILRSYLSSQIISSLFKMASSWRYTLVCLDGDMDISTTD